MGLKEGEPGYFQTGFTEEKSEFEKSAEEQAREDFYSLLTNGGAITTGGDIIKSSFQGIHTEKLDEKIQNELTTNRITRRRYSRVKQAFDPREEVTGQSFVHIVKPNILNYMAYDTFPGGGLRMIIYGQNPETRTIEYGDNSLDEALSNHFKNLKLREDPDLKPLVGKKISSSIMRKLIDREGFGSKKDIKQEDFPPLIF